MGHPRVGALKLSAKGKHTMSTNRIDGAAKKAAGSVKQAAGKLVGNERLQVEGAAEKAAGSVQNATGKLQDKVGNAIKK
jgi:uncharacterized protein YjbJ (UPF0337 family)